MTPPGPIRKPPETELPLRKLEKCSPSSGLIHTPSPHPTLSTKPSKMQAGYISVPTWSITWVLLTWAKLTWPRMSGSWPGGVHGSRESQVQPAPWFTKSHSEVLIRNKSPLLIVDKVGGNSSSRTWTGFSCLFFSLASLISKELSQIQLWTTLHSQRNMPERPLFLSIRLLSAARCCTPVAYLPCPSSWLAVTVFSQLFTDSDLMPSFEK